MGRLKWHTKQSTKYEAEAKIQDTQVANLSSNDHVLSNIMGIRRFHVSRQLWQVVDLHALPTSRFLLYLDYAPTVSFRRPSISLLFSPLNTELNPICQ